MSRIEQISEIRFLLDGNRLGEALEKLENYLVVVPDAKVSDLLTSLKTDFELMRTYWLKGIDDPKRGVLYDSLISKLTIAVDNLRCRLYIDSEPYLRGIHHSSVESLGDCNPATLRKSMESFVSDMAMLDLEPVTVRAQKSQQLYRVHFHLMSSIFEYIITAGIWTVNDADEYEQILLSPTIEPDDQLVILCAMMLSCIVYSDVNKLRVMVSAYLKTDNEKVRQYALVNWVMALRYMDKQARSYHVVTEQTLRLIEEGGEKLEQELVEVQQQIYYCANAEADTRKINNEIMPDLMSGNKFTIGEDDLDKLNSQSVDDILNSQHAESNMERVEESFRKMREMQSQGSDIYFGGFSQMKRLPFFNTAINWFLPYSDHHPVIEALLNGKEGMRDILNTLFSNTAFCDSDKYSMALVFSNVYDRIPAQMRDLLKNGEATFGPAVVSMEDKKSPAFIRRNYLQNIYRFFRLFSERNCFDNPFVSETTADHGYVFLGQRCFKELPMGKIYSELASFFYKQHAYKEAWDVLSTVAEESKDFKYYLLSGHVATRLYNYDPELYNPVPFYKKALEIKPTSVQGKIGLAYCLHEKLEYSAAADILKQLIAEDPDKLNFKLRLADCLTHLNEYTKAQALLFEIIYKEPDSDEAKRLMALCMLHNDKLEQADKLYSELLSGYSERDKNIHKYDIFYAGITAWMRKDYEHAIPLLHEYIVLIEHKFTPNLIRPHFDVMIDKYCSDLMLRYDITATDVQLMWDSIFL